MKRVPYGEGIVQVFDRPKGPVQLKDRHGVKAVLNGVVLEFPPGGTMEQVIRAGLVDVDLCNVPVGMLTDKLPQGQELGFRILVFVAGTDSSIEGNAHRESRPFYLSISRT